MANLQNPTLLFLEFTALLLKTGVVKLNDRNIFYTFEIKWGNEPYETKLLT